MAQQREFERLQQEAADRARIAQEQLLAQQMNEQMQHVNNQAAMRMNELEREILGMRGQYERDQLLLEQYDRVSIPSFMSKTALLIMFVAR